MVELNLLLQRHQRLKHQATFIYDTLIIITFPVLMFLAKFTDVICLNFPQMLFNMLFEHCSEIFHYVFLDIFTILHLIQCCNNEL